MEPFSPQFQLVSNTIQTIISVILGGVIGYFYDDTIRPLVLGILVLGLLALNLIRLPLIGNLSATDSTYLSIVKEDRGHI